MNTIHLNRYPRKHHLGNVRRVLAFKAAEARQTHGLSEAIAQATFHLRDLVENRIAIRKIQGER